MKIEVAKEYKTRSGDKVFINGIADDRTLFKYCGVLLSDNNKWEMRYYSERGQNSISRETNFDIVAPWEEEMKIEVGSDWINSRDERFTIKAVDEDKLFVKYDYGEHRVVSKSVLMAFCKPAPKRRFVYFNVYEHKVGLPYNSEEECRKNAGAGVLWTQKFEIIDPRENSDV